MDDYGEDDEPYEQPEWFFWALGAVSVIYKILVVIMWPVRFAIKQLGP